MAPLAGSRAHEALFWRRAARWGATRGPEWFVRYAPTLIGWAAAACIPSARDAVRRNLERVRGRTSPARDAQDVLETFATYAACLTDSLASDTEAGRVLTRVDVVNQGYLDEALAFRKGLVIVTAHTAGWDVVGPRFAERHGVGLVLVKRAEADTNAGDFHDEARRRAGVEVAHVGDPLASLPLLRHLKDGGVVALQLDRRPPGMKTRTTSLLGAPASFPEGPFRLAQLSGAPILPLFCERSGHRTYRVHVYRPRTLERRASEAAIDEVARHIGASMTEFLRSHPTQWFHFEDG